VKKLSTLAVLGAFVLAACGSGSNSVAATVDGEDITVGDVEALINADGATVTKEQFAQFLAFQIQWNVITRIAEDEYGITFTEEEVAAEADRIYDTVAAEGQTREDFVASRGVTEQFLQNIARQGLIDVEIRRILKEDAAEPTQGEIDDARETAALAATNVCASHILVATAAEADAVFARLDAGEEFADLAAELSTDTGSGANGGALGCSAPTAYVEPFAAAVMRATVGEVLDEAVETEFGYHVILVTEREEADEATLPTDEELIDGIKEQSIQPVLEEWFLSSVEGADVIVNEEFGTWQARPPSVIAPTDATTPTQPGDSTTSVPDTGTTSDE
jgi:parvulin-like peptidyl-prolyl isomerase